MFVTGGRIFSFFANPVVLFFNYYVVILGCLLLSVIPATQLIIGFFIIIFHYLPIIVLKSSTGRSRGDSQTSNSSSPGKIIDTQFGDQSNVCFERGDNGGGGEAEIGGGGVEKAEGVGS